MKKLFIVLCVVIMFFGIVGCPRSDDAAATFSKSSFTSSSSTSSTSVAANGSIEPVNDSAPGGNHVPEPATLILLGSSLVGLAGIGRKKFSKKD